MTTGSHTAGSPATDPDRLAKRRQERVTDLGPSPLQQLEAGFPVLYDVASEPVIEYPDGSRFVVRLEKGGEQAVHLREL